MRITSFSHFNFSVYHMEVAQNTEQRFLFPAFEKLHWYAADVILGKLTSKLLLLRYQKIYVPHKEEGFNSPLLFKITSMLVMNLHRIF